MDLTQEDEHLTYKHELCSIPFAQCTFEVIVSTSAEQQSVQQRLHDDIRQVVQTVSLEHQLAV